MGSAWAELPVPDYRESLLAQAESRADAQIAAGQLEPALAQLRGFRAHVADDARLAYEEGLLLRLLGQPELAQAQLEDAVARDPGLAHAWYDLGELLLAKGDQTQALAAFQQSADLTGTHPNGWAGPMRLAELAGMAGDPSAFDRHLKEALRRGFAFRTVAYDPRWSTFLGDPALGAVMARLMSVYGESELLESWQDSLR